MVSRMTVAEVSRAKSHAQAKPLNSLALRHENHLIGNQLGDGGRAARGNLPVPPLFAPRLPRAGATPGGRSAEKFRRGVRRQAFALGTISLRRLRIGLAARILFARHGVGV